MFTVMCTFQDGSLLQVYIGTGVVRSLCWYADHGLAACCNRSKVTSVLETEVLVSWNS